MSFDEYVGSLYEDIKSATNNFADANLIAQGSCYKVYKGKLFHSGHFINIVARKCLQMNLCINELLMCRNLKHTNIYSTLKFATLDVSSEPIIIINEHEVNGSLDKYLHGGSTHLTWMQRLKICLGVAHALSYIHNHDALDDDSYIIHGNIKSSKILLDRNWEPKLHGFGCSRKIKRNHDHFTSKYNGTLQYMDPAYEKTKTLTYKSDVFSFGVVLFEVLFGTIASSTPNEDHWYFARLARLHYEKKTLDDMIDPDLLKQMDLQSLKIFSETAYCCLKELRGERPDTDQIVKRLETALELQQKHQTPEHSRVAIGGTLPYHLKGKNLDHLKIRLSDIISATHNFSDTNIIGVGGYGRVYKAELFHFDSRNSSAIEGENKREFSKRRSTVAIKRLFTRQDGQLDPRIFSEIEMRTKCKHPNIVSLLGFCAEGPERILIYEYVTNGSLNNYLGNVHKMTNLTWAQRIQICLDIANGLNYLHTSTHEKPMIIHGDIKSGNILLDDNWVAKIADFGLSKSRRADVIVSSINTVNIVGTKVYLDPEYIETDILTKESDIYSFGVVLFEIMSGRVAYDPIYNNVGLPSTIRRCFNEGTFIDLVDPKLKETHENTFMLTGGLNQDSLDTFINIAYQCLENIQAERPTTKVIIEELEKALHLQEQSLVATGGTLPYYLKDKNFDHLIIKLRDIKQATNEFSKTNFIGQGGYGMVYKAELDHFVSTNSSAIEGKNKSEFSKTRSTVAIKRLFSSHDGQVEESMFFIEIIMLSNYKHPNIVSLLGFCEEDFERILIHEHASNGSLSDYLGNVYKMINLTWAQRIQICLDIANGLNYLHTSTQEKPVIIHRNIKSNNILLYDNLVAKIADIRLSKSHRDTIDGTNVYLDPEYMETGKLKKESDIYSLGVVFFEIMCGRVAYDPIYNANNDFGFPSTVRRCFNEGTLKDLVDPKLKETHESIFIESGLNQDSFNTFIYIAYQCLAYSQAERPTTKVIIEELEKALRFQKNSKDKLQISLIDIQLATHNFSDEKCIGKEKYWKQYKGRISPANTVVAKRFDNKSIQVHQQFLQELKVLSKYKHDNIVTLVGYCNERDEKIIVYKNATNGSLDRQLNNGSLTWPKRLKIGIDIASGLAFLHKDNMIHTDIKSANIVIDGDWKAKISNLDSLGFLYQDKEIEHVTRSLSYEDPLYKKQGYLMYGSDIYSLGVVLIEILSGRLASSFEESAGNLVKKYKQSVDAFDELVFKDIKQHSVPQSVTTFFNIASQCLELEYANRPNANEVVIQLNKALELQEDYEIWEPKLPTDYKEILLMSDTPDIYLQKSKKNLYDMLTNEGILLQQGKLWFVLGGNGERNEMISATKFSYKNRSLHKWKSIPESRFHKVAEMLDISNLMIKIKTRPQLLTPNAVYGVHLVFKFCDSRNFSSKPIYVNLKYRKGNETFHTYFATWRDDEWMMIELYRFLNQNEDVVFKFLLESLSLYNCGDDPIYVEGIGFRAIDNVEYEEVEKIKEVQQVLKSNSNVDQVQQLPIKSRERFKRSQNYDDGEKFVSEVNGKKHLMFSAKAALYNFSDLKLFNLKPLTESSFQEVIELLPQPVFCINCTIKSQMLSQDTDYKCYLVFKLSEKCQGLHCPVEVRDLLHRETTKGELIYFKSPSPWNLHDFTRVPAQREDGWMEVKVWKFSSQHELKNNNIPIKLKFISYEGTMSGLIVSGLEFRPM